MLVDNLIPVFELATVIWCCIDLISPCCFLQALELNGQYLEGREVHCEVAREREDRSQSSGKNWNSPAYVTELLHYFSVLCDFQHIRGVLAWPVGLAQEHMSCGRSSWHVLQWTILRAIVLHHMWLWLLLFQWSHNSSVFMLLTFRLSNFACQW